MGKVKDQSIKLQDAEENGVKMVASKKLNIHQKLGIIQSTLRVPKNQYNSFGKYKYRSLEDITEAVKPVLESLRLVLIMSDEIECHGERVYVTANVTLQCIDTKDSIMVHGYAREAESRKGMDESQITGTASTYARKYACNGLFSLDDVVDADALDAPKKAPVKKEKPADINAPQDARRNACIKAVSMAKDLPELMQIYENFIEFKNDAAIQQLFTKIKNQLT